jgi:hypothetical protein
MRVGTTPTARKETQMNRTTRMRTTALAVLTAVAFGLLTGLGGAQDAAAQEAGWYDYYGDGCVYWWDGNQYTGDYDCSAVSSSQSSGFAAGWYDPYGDGCLYYYDGSQYTGDSDCSAASTSNGYAAGWYDYYGDGCLYYYDGTQYTGDYDCSAGGDPTQTTYAAGWYDPYGDGCLYYYDGSAYSGHVDCDGDGAADAAQETYAAGWYDPLGNGCRYWFDGSVYTGEVDCGASEDASGTAYAAGWYDAVGDGCWYWYDGTQYTGDVDCSALNDQKAELAGLMTAVILATRPSDPCPYVQDPWEAMTLRTTEGCSFTFTVDPNFGSTVGSAGGTAVTPSNDYLNCLLTNSQDDDRDGDHMASSNETADYCRAGS